MKRIKYVMPKWLEPYRDLINNTGGNTIEDLIERLANDKNIAQTNSIVFAMAITVESQIHLLSRLKNAGLLRMEPEKSSSKSKPYVAPELDHPQGRRQK